MTLATGIGSMPGDDTEGFLRAVRVVLDEVHQLPFLPEVPGRGAIAGMTGRALAVVTDLGVDLQPAGWRLTDAAGMDHRRARSLLAQDLDVLEEQADGYAGSFKIQLAGPWTLAATVEKPRGARSSATTEPGESSPRPSPKGCARTSATSVDACPASTGWSSRSTSLLSLRS